MYSIEIETITELNSDKCMLIAQLMSDIPEFSTPYSLAEIEQRLSTKKALLQLVYVEGELSGFKLGYALTEDVFYSWLGGILPDFRKLGLARELLANQEAWVKQHGYHAIEVKTRNCFPAMLNMLISNSYQITTLEQQDEDLSQTRLYLKKAV